MSVKLKYQLALFQGQVVYEINVVGYGKRSYAQCSCGSSVTGNDEEIAHWDAKHRCVYNDWRLG